MTPMSELCEIKLLKRKGRNCIDNRRPPTGFRVAVSDLAEAVQHRFEGPGDGAEAVGGELVDEVPPDAGDVVRGDLADDLRAELGEHGEGAALVSLACLADDQAPGLHPAALMGEPAGGLRGAVGQLGHPKLPPRPYR